MQDNIQNFFSGIGRYYEHKRLGFYFWNANKIWSLDDADFREYKKNR